MRTIAQHEIDMQTHSLLTYLIWAVLLLATGLASFYFNITKSYANFENVLKWVSLVYVLVIPMLTMKTFSEERRQRTDQLLYALPVSMREVVLGKYFAQLILLFIPMVFTCAYPVLYSKYGAIHLPISFGTIFALFLMGAALIAVGLFISSLTENQGLAAAITAVFIVINYFSVKLAEFVTGKALGSAITVFAFVAVFALIAFVLTKSTGFAVLLGAVLEVVAAALYFVKPELYTGLVPMIMKKISLYERFYVFVNGDLDITGIVYFISVTAVFVFLTIQSMEKRRYN